MAKDSSLENIRLYWKIGSAKANPTTSEQD